MYKIKYCLLGVGVLILLLSVTQPVLAKKGSKNKGKASKTNRQISQQEIENSNAFYEKIGILSKEIQDGGIQFKAKEDWESLKNLIDSAKRLTPANKNSSAESIPPASFSPFSEKFLIHKNADENSSFLTKFEDFEKARESNQRFMLSTGFISIGVFLFAILLLIINVSINIKRKFGLLDNIKRRLETGNGSNNTVSTQKSGVLTLDFGQYARNFFQTILSERKVDTDIQLSEKTITDIANPIGNKIQSDLKNLIRDYKERLQNEFEMLKTKIPSEDLSRLKRGLQEIQSTDLAKLKELLNSAISGVKILQEEPEKLIEKIASILADDQDRHKLMVQEVKNAIGPVFAREVNAIRIDLEVVSQYLYDWFGSNKNVVTDLNSWKNFVWLGVSDARQKIQWAIQPINGSGKSGTIMSAYLYPRRSEISNACKLFDNDELRKKFQIRRSDAFDFPRPAIIQGVFYFDAKSPDEWKGYGDIILPGIIKELS